MTQGKQSYCSERQIDLRVILKIEIIVLSAERMSCSMDKRIFYMTIILHIQVCAFDSLQFWKRYKDILENGNRYNFQFQILKFQALMKHVDGDG